jgi:TRAP-type C4-dicarboxylate transport system permease small subunit
MILAITAQIFWRYVLQNPLVWAEEVARLLFLWTTFLGAGIAVRKRANIAIDALVERIPVKMRRTWDKVVNIVCLCFSIFMVVGSLSLVELGWIQPSPALQFPMAFFTLAIPVSGILMTIDILIHVFSGIKGQS